MLIDQLLKSEQFKQFIKEKAHTWLPAYFSRYELTPEERLLNMKKDALQKALVDTDPSKLEELLDLFPELVNQPLNNGELAINFAVKQNLVHTISMLLEKGADPKAKDRSGLNSIDIALQKRDKVLFSQLVSNATSMNDSDAFIKALDSTVVTGVSASHCLDNLKLEVKAATAELLSLKFESEKNESAVEALTKSFEKRDLLRKQKMLFQTILAGNFVSFKQNAKKEDIEALFKEVGSENLLKAAVLGGSLILDQILKMGIKFDKHLGDSTTHPLRFAFNSNDPIETFIPLFEKFDFDIHSVASVHRDAGSMPRFYPELDEVSYFQLMVFQKLKNAQDMDPIAVTGWDIAFATFSLCSFLVNYNHQIVPTTLIPFIRLGLNCSNYIQAISLLVFKLSYTREGKLDQAFKQLMTHYMVSQFFPVRIYYAGMTLYSAFKTCYDHRYRSYQDLCKKLIVQVPAATEVVHYTASSVYPRIKAIYESYFGGVKETHYNFNTPPPPPPPSDRNLKNNGSMGSSLVKNRRDFFEQHLENTPFMKQFGEESAEATRYKPAPDQEGSQTLAGPTVTGTVFQGNQWAYAPARGQEPLNVKTASAAIELGKQFHQDTAWYKEIEGTPLERMYNDIHFQAAATGSIKNYNDGFSLEGAFRVDLKGRSAFEDFVRTLIEGGARFELANANKKAIEASKGTIAQKMADGLDCLITGRNKACKAAEQATKEAFESMGSRRGKQADKAPLLDQK